MLGLVGENGKYGAIVYPGGTNRFCLIIRHDFCGLIWSYMVLISISKVTNYLIVPNSFLSLL